MASVREARFWEPLADGRVLCTLCPHDCRISAGGRGACGVRFNDDGTLYTVVYGRLVSRNVEPIEKKPLFHFHPGSLAYSVATVGCNLRCSFCQNWQISQWPKGHLPRRLEADGEVEHDPVCPQLAHLEDVVPGEDATPESVVEAALAAGATTIAYTYTEPTIFYEFAFDTAKLARERGLANVFVSNGYTGADAVRELSTVLDAVNVDLKFFREESYRRISRARLAPILDAIRAYRANGVWVELTTLVIPGVNDSDEELGDIARFVRSVGPEVPWHVSQFYPAYKMHEHPVTPVETIERARTIGEEAGLRYVYTGNVPGDPGEDTRCSGCGTRLVHRYGFVVRDNRIRDGACPECGVAVDGVGMSPAVGRTG